MNRIETFLTIIDEMTEATQEFIGDDEVTESNDPEGRLKDLAALDHVRDLFTEHFAAQFEDDAS